eukprot:7875801-Pyramimonas_sp.AAC.1
MNLDGIFGIGFEERANAALQLARARSENKLTKSFAWAVQCVDKYSKVVAEISGYTKAMQGIERECDELQEEVNEVIPMRAD